jgi:hypothetical protein
MKAIAALLLVAAGSSTAVQRSSIAREYQKSSSLANLLSRATPTENSQLPISNFFVRRSLENQQDDGYEVDITGYSLKFEKCQFVKAYDDELAQDKDSETVLATKRFVLFRLCPEGSCSSCNSGYGEYLVDLDSYLENTVQYFQGYQEAMCQACEDNCQADDAANNNAAGDAEKEGDDVGEVEEGDGRRRKLKNNNYNIQVDCSVCYDDCQKIQNLQANGYVEATDFLQCQMIYDPDDDSKGSLYAGPICASSGSKIKIGVFSDEDCLYLDTSKEVDDYLINDGASAKLSHALLKMTYSDTCVSCLQPQEQNNNNNNNNGNQEAKVLELCEKLYEDAAKCEKHHGFDNGYANYYGYENQLNQETVVCDFMTSLMSGTYDESGEIVISGASSAVNGAHATTAGQKFALSFFVLGTVALAIYAAMLHSKLVRGAKTDLRTSGVMA